jgi:hypothetical protein
MAQDLILSKDLIDVLVGNPGLNLTLADASQLKLEGGCIRFIRYGKNSEDIVDVSLDSGHHLSVAQTPGLKDFRESFECAAKYGMRVTYCISHDRRRIQMVNLYPCQCQCRPEDRHHSPVAALAVP